MQFDGVSGGIDDTRTERGIVETALEAMNEERVRFLDDRHVR